MSDFFDFFARRNDPGNISDLMAQGYAFPEDQTKNYAAAHSSDNAEKGGLPDPSFLLPPRNYRNEISDLNVFGVLNDLKVPHVSPPEQLKDQMTAPIQQALNNLSDQEFWNTAGKELSSSDVEAFREQFVGKNPDPNAVRAALTDRIIFNRLYDAGLYNTKSQI